MPQGKMTTYNRGLNIQYTVNLGHVLVAQPRKIGPVDFSPSSEGGVMLEYRQSEPRRIK